MMINQAVSSFCSKGEVGEIEKYPNSLILPPASPDYIGPTLEGLPHVPLDLPWLWLPAWVITDLPVFSWASLCLQALEQEDKR